MRNKITQQKKKKRFSRLAAVLMTGVCALTAAGIGGAGLLKEKTADAAEIGSLNTFDEFTIAGFVNFYDRSIASLEDQMTDLARSGLNWIDTPTWYTAANGSSGTDRGFIELSEYPHFNELCQELNMYFSMCPRDSVLAESEVEDMVTRAKDLDRCIGYYVKDEPSAAQMQSVAKICRKLQELDPTRFPYVNLFPNYAGASNLGGSYEDYVRNWVATGAETIEYLYFDHYPFTQFEDVRASYFSDVETIRKVAYENNRLKTGAYMQSGWWNGMRRPTVAETRWSMNSLLAYGMKSLSYFCWVSPAYAEPPAGEGMRDFILTQDGTPTDRYEPMQKMNWQTRQLGPHLMQFDVAHAYHSGNIPLGTEELPKSFLLQPSNKSDNLIFSLGYGKNSDDKYVMLFNKELEGTQTYTIKASKADGLTSLTWYKPDAFETLPDYTKPLAPAEEIEIDIESGEFTVELQAGELRLYKLNGDVKIKEPLSTPLISHKSGTYLGKQEVTFGNIDDGAEVHYTLDGTYPTYKSPRYNGPITIGTGEANELGFYSIKAIAVRGDEISDAVTAQYVIGDGARNVAEGRPVTFTGPTAIWQGSGSPDLITDGGFDPYNVYGSEPGTTCFAVVDLGEEYTVDKVVAKAYHDWAYKDVVIQLATDENFTQNVYTVYNNDADNSVGAGAGTDGVDEAHPDGNYVELGSGHAFKFEPVRARYIRFHNESNSWLTPSRSMWEEIQVYTAYDAGEELLTAQNYSTDWRLTGGGAWSYANGALSQTNPVNRTNWDASYTYTAKKFKNFVLEGKFTMNCTDPSAWGYIGFGLYKPNVSDVQSNVDHGYYAVIEPRGRALLWNGKKPELGPEDANVVGFSLGNEFTLRVVSVDDTVSISVNGRPAMYVQNEILNREAGYISLHSGLIPMDVSSVRIMELDEESKPLVNEDNVKSADETRIAVERFTTKADVIKALPQKMEFSAASGKRYELPVTWQCAAYDPSVTGYAVFTGTPASLPAGLKNLYGITATANVFVKPYTDTHDLVELVELGRSLREENFTPESWKSMLIKLEAAEALLADPFLVQNDIGVGVWQLYAEIYNTLTSTVDRTSLRTAIDETEKILQSNSYTELSVQKIQNALQSAQGVYDNSLATPDDVAAAEQNLEKAVRDAVTPVVVKQPVEKMQSNLTTRKKSAWPWLFLGLGIGLVVAAAAVVLIIKFAGKGSV